MGLLLGLGMICAAFALDGVKGKKLREHERKMSPYSKQIGDILWDITMKGQDDQGNRVADLVGGTCPPKMWHSDAVKYLGRKQCERMGIPWDEYTANFYVS